jgi:hypothetical protein
MQLPKKLPSSWFQSPLHREKNIPPPYTSLDLVQKLLSDWLWVPLLYLFVVIGSCKFVLEERSLVNSMCAYRLVYELFPRIHMLMVDKN